MFVQVIEGKVSDKAGLRRQMDRWEAELRPGAAGFLGSTGGVTDDGVGFAIARFESADAARANSERPEQGKWWSETEKCYEGPVSFTDSEDVEEFLERRLERRRLRSGDEDRQRCPTRRIKELDEQFEKHASTWRPDLIGGVRVWTGKTSTVEVNYFTSEAEARANESKDPPAELAALFAKYGGRDGQYRVPRPARSLVALTIAHAGLTQLFAWAR